jgi:hypothetical protein
MKILHGTWIPHSGDEFIQGGDFYLWVETDTPPNRQQQPLANSHPQHLDRKNLATFLLNELGIPAPKYIPALKYREQSPRNHSFSPSVGKEI